MAFRIHRLKEAERKPGSKISTISDSYYALAHEIKSLSYDSLHDAGCDYILNWHYQIECVYSSAGDTNKFDWTHLSFWNTLDRIIDYRKKLPIVYSRLTSSLKDKLEFFQKHIKEHTMNARLPYIIFLGLGSLAMEIISGDNGIHKHFTWKGPAYNYHKYRDT